MDLLVAASTAEKSDTAAPSTSAPAAAPPRAPESDAAGDAKNVSGGLTATSLEEAAAAAYHRSLEGEDEPSSTAADANRSLVPTPGSAAGLTAAAGVDFGAGRVSRAGAISDPNRSARAADRGRERGAGGQAGERGARAEGKWSNKARGARHHRQPAPAGRERMETAGRRDK